MHDHRWHVIHLTLQSDVEHKKWLKKEKSALFEVHQI